MADHEITDADVFSGLGAQPGEAGQQITLYFPRHDRDGRELDGSIEHPNGQILEDVETFVGMAMALLEKANHGFTRLPLCKGAWVRSDGQAQREETIILYSYLKNGGRAFMNRLPQLKEIFDQYAEACNQEEIFFELKGEWIEGQFLSRAYTIRYE